MTVTVDVAMRESAVEVLCDSSLSHVVDLVAWPDGDAVYVANSDGSARLRERKRSHAAAAQKRPARYRHGHSISGKCDTLRPFRRQA